MKMTKKLIFAAVAVAAIVGFASCQKEIGDIDWKGGVVGSGDGNTTFTVNQKNDEDYTIRGMKQVGLLDRAQGTCVVRQFDQGRDTSDGMVGFACCFTQNNDKTKENNGTYNFLVVGVRNHLGTTQTYASFFYNIPESSLSTENFGVPLKSAQVKSSYTPNDTKPYEVELVKFPKTLNVKYDEDGTLTVAINLTIGSSNDIKITWLKDVTENHQAAETSGGVELYSWTVDAQQIGTDAATKKGKICTYANIYGGKTLNAKWDIYDISWSKDASFFAEDDDFIEVGDVIFE